MTIWKTINIFSKLEVNSMKVITLTFSPGPSYTDKEACGVFSSEENACIYIKELETEFPEYYNDGEFETENQLVDAFVSGKSQNETVDDYKKLVAEYQEAINEIEAELAIGSRA